MAQTKTPRARKQTAKQAAQKPGPAATADHALTTDVIIVGGGLAGMTLGSLLGTAGVDCICVDRQSVPAMTERHYDGRTTAISLASRRVLEAAGVWDIVTTHGHAEPILDIKITDDVSPVFLNFDSRDVGDQPFGHIVDNLHMRHHMMARINALTHATYMAPAGVVDYTRDTAGVTVTLDTGQTITAPLLVGADGRRSPTRDWAGIGLDQWQYNQTAIVCNVTHSKPHHNWALEHFMPAGPFAVLPLPNTDDGRHRSSVVWTKHGDDAAPILALDDNGFNAELQAQFGDYLGEVSLYGNRFSYPLSVIHAKAYIAPRTALVAEAAHAIHPIAGQGLNLGMRDIAALAELVVDAKRLGLDIGSPNLLLTYQRWRRQDNVTLLMVTDGLNRLFSNDVVPVKRLRQLGLAAVERLPPLKKFFMRHAMGSVGSLPRVVRGEAL
ncbi:MAG: UbiH/UbiF/VisC/COQ6 family ubiquinone biosynthesis hydroxylase [Pseudomonadota bacterium]